jgi:ribosomal protein L16 Arg81 hydroxylase
LISHRLLPVRRNPEFLEKYWQKQPVVLKNAFPDFVDPITPDELAGLAMELLLPVFL